MRPWLTEKAKKEGRSANPARAQAHNTASHMELTRAAQVASPREDRPEPSGEV